MSNANYKSVLAIDDKVKYTDQYGDRTGTVIEIDLSAQRARIKWDGRKPRTWIRFSALRKILVALLILLAVSCTKIINNPPAPPEPKPAYHLVITCVKYRPDTLVTRSGFIILRNVCTESRVDTVKN